MSGHLQITTQNPPLAGTGERDLPTVSLSALQHYAFCPRQCALIHNEQVWAENYLTAQGQALHERVDSGEPETRKGVRFERSVHVAAENLGISGIIDMVEHDPHTGCLKPVECKRGKPKPEPMDEIQLCAQALCLEEMTEQTIAEGALWYMQTHHRVPVLFSNDLRAQTLDVIAQVRELLTSGQTPPSVYGKRCKACSLVEICQPKLLERDWSVGYVEQLYDK